MGRVVYFDCPSGASGDMVLGALLDVGVSVDALRIELERLRLPGWTLGAREVRRGAFRATKADVQVDPAAPRVQRGLRDITGILDASGLPVKVVDAATRIFTRLAEAEALVHGTTVHEVHFHEVGAIDAIVDVAGAVLGLHLLGAERVHVSALPLGGGFVDTAHGRMPIPGPGTAELLRGFPVVDTGVRAELVTPTGAAILTTLAAGAGRMPPMTVERVGYGAGTVDLPGTPNVLR
ncbi:MAG TPA: LarC family nickel insertion protein, partial [Methylomirabilota bacterium]